ncbi:MAG: mechanosensitive ion channel domain-containing protein, partial [Myxococcota bacterium]
DGGAAPASPGVGARAARDAGGAGPAEVAPPPGTPSEEPPPEEPSPGEAEERNEPARDVAEADRKTEAEDRAAPTPRERAPGEGAERPPEEERDPSFVPVPVASGDDEERGLWDLAREVIPVLPESRTGSALGLLAALIVAAVGTSLARRAREGLPVQGVLPRLMQVLHTALRLGVVGLAIALIVRLLPPWMGPALPWVLLAAAAALGWSTRDLLPDVVAGVVILFERRIRRGMWIAGESFSGVVAGIGLRATWVVDARGHRIAVPNRRLLSGPVTTDSAVGAEHEVTLRMDVPAAAGRVRQALRDAVLQSPWVPPGAAPVVLRDPDEPSLWHVRSRLLEARFAPRFEGELLERAEELLARGTAGTFPLDEELDDA